MSEFNTPDYLKPYLAAVAKANEQVTLIRALAGEVSARNAPQPAEAVPFGYCATAGLKFELPAGGIEDHKRYVEQLLAAYPPLPVVDLYGIRTQKPVEALRDAELNEAGRELYPVLFRTDLVKREQKPATDDARWWTSFPCGTVEVMVRRASAELFPIPMHAYEADSHTYATGRQSMYRRRPKTYPALTERDALRSLEPLEAFRLKLRNTGAELVLNAVRDRLLRVAPSGESVVTLEMLTESSEVAFNPLKRLTPSRYLTEVEAQELVELVGVAGADLAKELLARRAELQALVAKGAELVAAAVAPFKGFVEDIWVALALEQLIAREVGNGVRINWCKLDYSRTKFEIRVSRQFTSVSDVVFKDVTVPVNQAGRMLTWKDIGLEFVDL